MSPAEQAAYDMGAAGSPHSEDERKLFEAYMRGHCWAIGKWLPDLGYYEDTGTRMLFGVWRDRAALAAAQAQPLETTTA